MVNPSSLTEKTLVSIQVIMIILGAVIWNMKLSAKVESVENQIEQMNKSLSAIQKLERKVWALEHGLKMKEEE